MFHNIQLQLEVRSYRTRALFGYDKRAVAVAIIFFSNSLPFIESFSAVIQCGYTISTQAEVTLRLTYGHIHLEFIMLSGEKVAIRDSSRNKPSCAGLHQFFELISKLVDCDELIVSASPAGTPLSACLSVPPNPDAATVSPATEVSAELETSSTPVIIDHETLRRAFVFVKSPKNSPPSSDIATLERYFEQVVCRLNNELAVFSFINLCRIVANGAISGIVQVMNAQMVGFSCKPLLKEEEPDPSPSLYWNVSIQLVCLAREQANANTRRYQTGTVFDANNINVLILVSIPHVRGRVSSANVAGMPASVGYMPGSVGGPVSVGPIGSVGTGHNPGSIVNPGSNT
ncbi:unnamed protein product [Angiostrongylus costaricensis]|uniref:Mediator of RNA polymerase II transcription subunit 13 n=1 Tax=Angiostrongylus costaricensis TaxID=334426 RepID=A0A158PFG0_ANGCS|nr:unnamed protein product [Angiostrongylus costaricensis]